MIQAISRKGKKYMLVPKGESGSESGSSLEWSGIAPCLKM